MERGFLTIELLIALAILTLSLSSISLVLFGLPEMIENAHLEKDALSIARSLIEKEQTFSNGRFLDGFDYSGTVDDGFDYTVSGLPLADEGILEVIVSVSWKDVRLRDRSLVLQSTITDHRHASVYSCNARLAGDWSSASVEEHLLSPGSLLPAGMFMQSYRADVVAASRTHIAVAARSTLMAIDPTIFIFAIEEDVPIYRGSIDTTATTAGVNDMAIVEPYLYVASASTCTNGPLCGQLQIIDLSDPELPVMAGRLQLAQNSPPFASSGSAPIAASSIAIRDSMLFLGLEQITNPSGEEFVMIDISDLRNPTYYASLRTSKTINSVTVRGTRAYLGTNDRAHGDVVSIDLTVPEEPAILAVFAAPPLSTGSKFGYVHDVQFAGNAVFAARTYVSNANELYTLDSKTLAARASRDIGTLTHRLSAESIRIRGTLLALLTNEELQFWDVLDPSEPHRISTSIALTGEGTDMACAKNALYVASTLDGIGRLTVITGS